MFEYNLSDLWIEVVQSVPYFVKPQNLLCNEGMMPHNEVKVCVANYVSYIEHIAFRPMIHVC